MHPFSPTWMILRPAANLGVKVDPLFSVEEKGVEQIFCVYATKKPQLSQKYAAVGCYIQRGLLGRSVLSNGTFCMFDAAQKRKFSERQVTNMTAQILRSDARRLSGDIEDLEG